MAAGIAAAAVLPASIPRLDAISINVPVLLVAAGDVETEQPAAEPRVEAPARFRDLQARLEAHARFVQAASLGVHHPRPPVQLRRVLGVAIRGTHGEGGLVVRQGFVPRPGALRLPSGFH